MLHDSPPVRTTDSLLELWRVSHRGFINHFRRCTDCGLELCPDGQTLSDAADDAERKLPWMMRA